MRRGGDGDGAREARPYERKHSNLVPSRRQLCRLGLCAPSERCAHVGMPTHIYDIWCMCAMRHAVHLNHLVARLHVLLLYTILAFKMPHPSHALVCTTAHTTRIRQKTGQFLTRSPSYLGRDRETVHRRAACVGDGASAQAAAAARPRSTGRAAQLEARRSDRRKVVEGGVLILILGGQSLGGGRRCSGRLGGGCVGGAARQGRVGEDAGAGHDFDLHLWRCDSEGRGWAGARREEGGPAG